LSFSSGGSIAGTDIVSAPVPFPAGVSAHEKLVLAVNANSENKELAKDFIRWFLTDEGQSLIRPWLGASTIATDGELSAEFTAANPWAQTFIEAGKTSKAMPIVGFELQTAEIFRTIMEAVERVLTEGQDPAEALREAQTALE
jgi:multiple sugar transport system substrate-binding protein